MVSFTRQRRRNRQADHLEPENITISGHNGEKMVIKNTKAAGPDNGDDTE